VRSLQGIGSRSADLPTLAHVTWYL